MCRSRVTRFNQSYAFRNDTFCLQLTWWAERSLSSGDNYYIMNAASSTLTVVLVLFSLHHDSVHDRYRSPIDKETFALYLS